MITSANDMSIVRNMMLTKSYKQIGQLLDCSEDEIAEAVKEVNKEMLVTFQDKINAKRKVTKVVKKEKLQEERFKEQVLKNKAERIRVERHRQLEKGHRNEERYQTRHRDYSKMRMIKIDRMTYIYAPHGEEEKTKEEYLKLYKSPLEKIEPVDKTRSY